MKLEYGDKNKDKYKDKNKEENRIKAKKIDRNGAVNDGEISKSGVDSRERNAFFENQADIWLTTQEAADFLRISSKSLLNLTSNGRIRYFKFGRRNRFLLSELHKSLLAQARGGSYGN